MSITSKPSRNAACPCGSGKKFKACCAGSASEVSRTQAIDLEDLHRQAQRAVAEGDFARAEAVFRQLVTLKPGDAQFQAGLGQALCWRYRRKEGVGHLLQTARLLERQAGKNRDPRFLIELSAQLAHWGEMAAAERLARMAVALNPRSPVTLNNLVLCLTRVNRNSEALPIAQRNCLALPDHPGCNILLAILEAKLVDSQQALSRLDRVIEGNLEAEQTARAWLEKAVILDKVGRYDEAFAALTVAGEAHGALSPYSPAQRELIFDTLERNAASFDRQLLQRWPAEKLIDDGLPAPAFLMGFLRSGTTLTEQVLASHPQIVATDEGTIIHELTLELERVSGVSSDHARALSMLNVAQIKALRSFYWQRMREEYGEQVMSKCVVDKNALNTIDLGVISVVFPEAKILFALRDPRDVCLSCFMQAFSPSPATVNLTSLAGIVRQYSAVMQYWLGLRETMQPSYMHVRYEDTVTNFEPTYRQVFEFLGVDWHAGVTKFHQRAQGRYISTPSFAAVSQPIYSSAVQRWRHYSTHFAAVEAQLQPFAIAFGYQEEQAESQ